MMLDVDIDAEEVLVLLAAMRLRLSAERIPAFLDNTVANYLRQRIDERFSVEGDDVTGKWQALTWNTARIRALRGYGAQHPINRRTGRLLAYVKTARVQSMTLTMPGTGGSKRDKEKLSMAQLGGPTRMTPGTKTFGPSRNTPARPVLGLNERDSMAVVSQLHRWVMGAGVV